jgi:hypothetical protein
MSQSADPLANVTPSASPPGNEWANAVMARDRSRNGPKTMRKMRRNCSTKQ